MKITGCILAAGTSTRMGRNKLLMNYGQHTVIEQTLQNLQDSDLEDIIIITGHERSQIEAVLTEYLSESTRVIYNDRYLFGRAESIKCAVRSVHNDTNADAILFMVADKPDVSTDLINRAIHKFSKTQPSLLYVMTPKGRGHPIMFSRALFDDLLTLEGDLIGQEFVARCGKDAIELRDDAIQIDIDTMQDYRKVVE